MKHYIFSTIWSTILFSNLCLGIIGDINGSGRVDGQDLAFMARYYDQATNSISYIADLNKDGLINTNDFAILNSNFGKTGGGGAAVWLSTHLALYKIGIDKKNILATITGFSDAPSLQAINPDNGEAWVKLNQDIYVFSPYVPKEYDVSIDTGFHNIYHVPNLVAVSLSSGTNAAVITKREVYHWHDFPQDYIFTNDLNRTYYTEFTGFGRDLIRVVLIGDTYIWTRDNYDSLYYLDLSAPKLYNINDSDLYDSLKNISGISNNSYDQSDALGNAVIMRDYGLSKVSKYSMGITADIDYNPAPNRHIVAQDDNSVWLSFNAVYNTLPKIVHLSADMNEVLTTRSLIDLGNTTLQDIDTDRKYLWGIYDYNRSYVVLDYLGNTVFTERNLDSSNINSLKLFLPKTFSGYPFAKVLADTSKGIAPLTVNFSGTNSYDVDGNITHYAWDFNGDGRFDLQGDTLSEVSHVFSEPGVYPIMLRVTDDDGLQSYDSSLSVRVGPLVVIPHADPTNTFAGTSVNFSAEIIDGMGNGKMENISWDFDDDGVWDYVSLSTALTSFRYSKPGIYNAHIKLLSKAGEIAEAYVKINVLGSNPTARIYGNPYRITTPQTVNFTVNWTDQDGTVQSVFIDFDDDGIYEYNRLISTATTSVVVPYHVSTYGNNIFKAYVVDDDGNKSDVASCSVPLDDSSSSLVITPSTVNAIGSVTAATTPRIISGEPDSFSWDLYKASASYSGYSIYGQYKTAQTSITIDELNQEGTYFLIQREQNLSAKFSVYPPNQPQAVLKCSPTNGVSPQNVVFDASDSSAVGEIVSYKWYLDGTLLFDDAENNNNAFLGPKERIQSKVYQGDYSYRLENNKSICSKFMPIIDNQQGVFSFYACLTNQLTSSASVIFCLNSSSYYTEKIQLNGDWQKISIPFSLSKINSDDFYVVIRAGNYDICLDSLSLSYQSSESATAVTTTPSYTHLYTNPGQYAATVAVQDDLENISFANLLVEMAALPEIKILKPSSGQESSFDVDFEASVKNPESVTGYYWDFDGDGTIEISQTTLSPVDYRFDQTGNYTTYLLTNLKNGQVLTNSVSFSIKDDLPPQISAFKLSAHKGHSPLRLYSDLAVDFGNSDLDILIWQINDNPCVTNQLFHQYDYISAVGIITQKVTALAQNGLSASTQAVARVLDPSTILITAQANPTSTFVGAEIAFDAKLTIPWRSSPLEFEWDFDNDGIIDWSSTNSPITSNSYDAVGNYMAKVTVMGTNGFVDYDYIDIAIRESNAFPTSQVDQAYFIVSSSSVSPTNFISFNNDKTIKAALTNYYDAPTITRSDFDGTFYIQNNNWNMNRRYLDKYDHNFNFISRLTNSSEYLLDNNFDFKLCPDNDSLWIRKNYEIRKFDKDFNLSLIISNQSQNIEICPLANGKLAAINIDNNAYTLNFYDVQGVKTAEFSLFNTPQHILYNHNSTSLWIWGSSEMINLYSLDGQLIKTFSIPESYGNFDIKINQMDGSVWIEKTSTLYYHYDAWGNFLSTLTPYNGFYRFDVDYQNSGIIGANSYNVYVINPDGSIFSSNFEVPFYYYNLLRSSSPYFTKYRPANRATLKGSYDASALQSSGLVRFSMAVNSAVAIKYYQWDFEGDGVVDYISESNLIAEHLYTESGTYFPNCKILDNNGVIIIDTSLKPIEYESIDSVSASIFVTPQNAVTGPVSVTVMSCLDGASASRVDIYLDTQRILNAYNPQNPIVHTRTMNLSGEFTFRVDYYVGEKIYQASQKIEIFAQAPVPIASYSAQPTTAPAVVSLDASSSYSPNSSIDYIQWDINNDGNFDYYSEDLTKIVKVMFPTQVVTEVVLRVVNSEGLYADTNMTINIVNSIPVATLTIEPPKGIAPFTSKLNYSAVDRDGTISKYALDVDGDGVIDHVDTLAGSYAHTYTNKIGSYTAKLLAIDSNSMTGEVTATATVLEPGTPIAHASATPLHAIPPTTVSLAGICTNQTVDLYEWDLDADGVYEWSSQVTGSLDIPYETKGLMKPVFRVTSGSKISDPVELKIYIGEFPIVQPRAMPLLSTAPQEVTFTADGIDPDGTILYFFWDFNDTGNFVAYDPISDSPKSYYYNTSGTYTSRLIAQDDTGFQATGDVVVTVLKQEIPQVSARVKPEIATIGQSVSFYGYATDENGAITQTKWNFGDGTAPVFGNGGRATHAYSVAGLYDALFIATDNDGNSATATVFVTVVATGSPELLSSVVPTAGDMPLTVQFELDAVGLDAIVNQYEIDFGDGSDSIKTTEPQSISHTYYNAGVYQAELKVTDANGRTTAQKVSINVGGKMQVTFNKEKFDPTLSESVDILVFIPLAAKVSLNVKDQYGNLVAKILDDQSLTSGVYEVNWNGRDLSDNYIADGTYYFVGQYNTAGHTYVYDPSYDVPGVSSPIIDKSTVQEKKFTMFGDNPLMIGFTLAYRSEMSLYMAKNPTGVNVTPHLYNRVKTIFHHTPLVAGKHFARWDTTDDNGDIAVDPYSVADYFFYIWNWQLPVNSIIIESTPKITDINIEGEPNYFSAGINPYTLEPTNEMQISYSVSKPVAKVYVDIMKANGQLVRSFVYDAIDKGTHNIGWDGRTVSGVLTAAGEYKLAIKAEDYQGNTSDHIYDLFKIIY